MILARPQPRSAHPAALALPAGRVEKVAPHTTGIVDTDCLNTTLGTSHNQARSVLVLVAVTT
ncbi:hypothetical protein NJB1604_34240 [Mycobacterium marinum]|nr:hypothetical protein NJB1604_34240 [Mycobacterium marinum]